MTIEEQITIFEHNAEHERKEGDLNNCLHFCQLAEWLKELKAHREAWEKILGEMMDVSIPGQDAEYVYQNIYDIIRKYRPKEGDSNADSD